MNERLLVIDCATPMLSLALFDGTACIASSHDELGRGHAESLLPRIAALPDGGRCDRILVDIGPGSFTGVRVGLAAATGLGFAWQVPVNGYGCLDLVAAMARAQLKPAQSFATVMVGGHGELFWALCPPAGDPAAKEPTTVQSTPIAMLAGQIDTSLLVGSGARILVEAGARGEVVPLLPDARDVFLLSDAQRMLAPRPVYGRGADAKPMVQRAGQKVGAP